MFRIFTDLGANLPWDLVERHDLGMVPIYCAINGQQVDSSRAFDGKAFYDAMRAGAETKTSMASMGAFADAFRPTLEQGQDILYIGMSSGISGTVGAAASMAAELQEEYPDRRVVVIDTRAASLGEGLPVLYAAGLREQGMELDEVVRRTEDAANHMYQVFTVEDLRYLQRGGRLHSTTAKVGNLLNVKPILWGNDRGQIVLRHMNVGRRRSLDTLASKYKDHCMDMNLNVGLAHGDCQKDMEYVVEKLRQAGCTGEIMTVCYEPVTGSHVGPGTVALFFYGPTRDKRADD